MYDQREKAQRDYEWALSGAREEGRQEGREEGREEGRQEGKLAGSIQLLQQLLGDRISLDGELLGRSAGELNAQLAQHQQRLRDRPT